MAGLTDVHLATRVRDLLNTRCLCQGLSVLDWSDTGHFEGFMDGEDLSFPVQPGNAVCCSLNVWGIRHMVSLVHLPFNVSVLFSGTRCSSNVLVGVTTGLENKVDVM